jgi:hypothetical protein
MAASPRVQWPIAGSSADRTLPAEIMERDLNESEQKLIAGYPDISAICSSIRALSFELLGVARQNIRQCRRCARD